MQKINENVIIYISYAANSPYLTGKVPILTTPPTLPEKNKLFYHVALLLVFFSCPFFSLFFLCVDSNV